MPKWYEIPEKDRTPEQKQACWLAYHSTLLKTSLGREVLCDFERRLRVNAEALATQPELAVIQVWRDNFLQEIFRLCDCDKQMALNEARSEIGGHYVPEQAQSRTPEDHAE